MYYNIVNDYAVYMYNVTGHRPAGEQSHDMCRMEARAIMANLIPLMHVVLCSLWDYFVF